MIIRDGNQLCKGMSVAFDDTKNWLALANLMCAECPVKQACKEEGKTQEWGLWGGIPKSDTTCNKCTLGSRNPCGKQCKTCKTPMRIPEHFKTPSVYVYSRGLECNVCKPHEGLKDLKVCGGCGIYLTKPKHMRELVAKEKPLKYLLATVRDTGLCRWCHKAYNEGTLNVIEQAFEDVTLAAEEQ